MLGELEKCGYFLYYDHVTKLWEVCNEDEDAPFFNFKSVDKDKVIIEAHTFLKKHLDFDQLVPILTFNPKQVP
jgi:hypothetical protein